MSVKDSILNVFELPAERRVAQPYLYGLAALAVVLVTIGDCWTLSGQPVIAFKLPLIGNLLNITPLFEGRAAGIELIFVLAGLVMARPWVGPVRPRIKDFYRYWFWRGGPTYYIALAFLLLFFVPTYISQEAVFSRDGAVRVGAHLLFLQFLLPVSATSWTVNSALWIITLLALFVVITPWLARLFEGRRWPVSLPVAALVGLGWLWLAHDSLGPLVTGLRGNPPAKEMSEVFLRDWLAHQLPAYLFAFGLGMALANLSGRTKALPTDEANRLWRRLNSPVAGWGYSGLGAALLLYSLNKTNTDPTLLFSYYLSHLLLALGWGLLILGIERVGSLRAGLGWWPLRLVGRWAYSIYLWHLPLIYLFQSYPEVGAMIPPQRFRQILLYEAVAGLVLGAVFYLTAHRPFLARAERYTPAPVEPTETPSEVAELTRV